MADTEKNHGEMDGLEPLSAADMQLLFPQGGLPLGPPTLDAEAIDKAVRLGRQQAGTPPQQYGSAVPPPARRPSNSAPVRRPPDQPRRPAAVRDDDYDDRRALPPAVRARRHGPVIGAVAAVATLVAAGTGYAAIAKKGPFAAKEAGNKAPLTHSSQASHPSSTPDLVPSSSTIPSPTVSTTTSALTPGSSAPSPTSTELLTPNHLFRPAPLGCTSDLQINIDPSHPMQTRVTLNYTFPATTTKTSTPAKPATSKSSASKTPVAETTPPLFRLTENVYYAGTLTVKVCANDAAAETVDPRSINSAQIIKIDETKYSYIFDPTQMKTKSDLTNLGTKAQNQLIAKFKAAGKNLTPSDIAAISSFASKQLPSLSNYNLNQLAIIMDKGIDGSKNGQPYQSEAQGLIEADIEPIVKRQADEQGIQDWAYGKKPNFSGKIPLFADAVAKQSGYKAEPSKVFSYDGNSTLPGVITITSKQG